jgi:hypothetical protein
MHHLWRCCCGIVASGIVLGGGCAPSPPLPKTIKVEGKATFAGGEWPRPAVLSFVVDQPAEGFPAHSGTAEVRPDGSFQASTFAPGDGLVPGTYFVNVECWESDPADSPSPPASLIPPQARSGAAAGRRVEVRPQEKIVSVTFDVPQR